MRGDGMAKEKEARPQILVQNEYYRDILHQRFRPKAKSKAKEFDRVFNALDSTQIEPIPFWVLVKWAVDEYDAQEKTVSKKERYKKEKVSLREHVRELNKLDAAILKAVKGRLIKNPYYEEIPYQSVFVPTDAEKRHEYPITAFIMNMMRISGSLEANTLKSIGNHRAAKITHELMRLFFPEEIFPEPESIRTSYLRFIRP
jgi:hypothetical protein